MLIGTTRGLGGSWGEEFVAHEDQLVRVPEAMSDESAVLIEPFACSVHAVRANLPERGRARARDRRGVDRAAHDRGDPRARARRAHHGARALRYAARAREPVGRGGGACPRAATTRKALADAGGTRLLKPIIGKPVGVGGFDRTFVCIGGARGMDDAMRVTRAGGTIVLLGNSSTMNGLDWTPLWLKELTVRGSLCYGSPVHASASAGAFAEAATLIASGAAPIARAAHAHLRARRLSQGARDGVEQGGRREHQGGVQVLCNVARASVARLTCDHLICDGWRSAARRRSRRSSRSRTSSAARR